ncbi:MAG TPA: hypothetical protein VFW25_08025 [Silvibacterium sp.]|nr:hypothetical protein [Silvibacterium sp.]
MFPVLKPVVANGAQANIIGFNNLYDGTCPSSGASGQPFVPRVKFAYFVDAGSTPGSPVLSEDGTRVAFVTYGYNLSGMNFHVVTLGSTGNNGTAYTAPVTPCTVNGVQSCTTNNAVDASLHISTVTNSIRLISSPFVDYSGDIAYVVDQEGYIHKFTGVFRGTPSEITTGAWPFLVTFGEMLSSPVYDNVSQHLFLTSYSGHLYCIDVGSGTPALCGPTGKISIATSGLVWDAPIVDSTVGTVFAEGGNYNQATTTLLTVTQANTNLGNVVQASMGGGTPTLYDGDFDNSYYTGNYASGYLYVCAETTEDVETLYRIGFNSSGTMNSANDGNSYALAPSSGGPCTPLTEAYNPNQGKDYLFVGLNWVTSQTGCDGDDCILSFVLGPEFPSAPAATLPLDRYYGTVSGIIIDNVSTETGASQIYFTDYYSGNAMQASQNGLN